MTERHPDYFKKSRKPAKAGRSKYVYFIEWLAIVVSTDEGYCLINPASMNRIDSKKYNYGQEIPNAYECTQEEILEIKNSLFSS